MIYFLARDSNIIQIAARSLETDDSISMFVRPKNGLIPLHISKLTGIEMHELTMYCDMIPVPSYYTKDALTTFAEWIDKHPAPIIAAHNASFDARILVSACKNYGVEFRNLIEFADTIKIFKQEYPNQSSYKLHDLVQTYGSNALKLSAHNAVNDVVLLKDLLTNIPTTTTRLSDITFSVEHVAINNEKIANKAKYLDSYCTLISDKVLTKTQCSSLASNGLNPKHLQLAFERGGEEGLELILKGKIRKTSAAARNLMHSFKQN
jgi:DNA polymerase III epsilon subunit-like protein